MNVSAVIVTRGDVDLDPILDELPDEWQVIVWDNASTRSTRPNVTWWPPNTVRHYTFAVREEVDEDRMVKGRYDAIEYATGDLIYVQDDDVLVSDPERIVAKWIEQHENDAGGRMPRYTDHIVANVPENFRHEFYRRHCLVGFGAVFHRDSPQRAFDFFEEQYGPSIVHEDGLGQYLPSDIFVELGFYQRTCDIVFTGLSRFFMVDVPKTDREMASADNRMWRQKTHVAERSKMLDLVLAWREEAIKQVCEEQDERFKLQREGERDGLQDDAPGAHSEG